jgi:hypothetical protein
MMQKLAHKARLTYQAATNRGCHTLLTDHTGIGVEHLWAGDVAADGSSSGPHAFGPWAANAWRRCLGSRSALRIAVGPPAGPYAALIVGGQVLRGRLPFSHSQGSGVEVCGCRQASGGYVRVAACQQRHPMGDGPAL